MLNRKLSRLWAIVNPITGDIIYSSSEYNTAKSLYDSYKRKESLIPISLIRYDLARSYWDEFNRIVESDIHKALAAAVKLCKGTQPKPTTGN